MAAPQAVGDSFSTLEGQVLRSAPGDYAQSVIASQPLAYWRLGEAAGDATARDEMGRLDGHYILGSTPLAADALLAEDNGARAFDGYMGRVFIEPDANYTELTSSFSVEAWIYPTIAQSNHRVISTLGSQNNTGGFGFGIAAQQLRFTLFGVEDYTLPAPGIPTNQWTHVAAVLDASYDVSFYINGAFAGKVAGNTPGVPSDARLVLGGLEGVGEQWWAGAIDEVALYSRTVSGGEIAAHYQAGLRTAAFNVLGNDSDADGNALSAVLETPPQHGQLALQASGAFEYTPNPGYSGSDSFTYRASDGQDLSAPATVNLSITPVDQPPSTQEDHYVLPATGPLVVAPAAGVLVNDVDAEGAALIAELIEGPAHGSVAFNANGGFQYQPSAGAFAVDQFTYRAFDGQGRSAVTTVHLAAANLSAGTIARDDRYSLWATNSLTVGLTQTLLANDVDFQGDALSARLVGLPAHGVVHLNADGTFTYVPADGFTGVDTFLYRATDGAHESNLGTVSIEVTALPFQVIEWPVAEGGNGHFYGLAEELLPWALARDKAVTMAYHGAPGDLTSITSAAEQAWFESHLPTGGFLGGYQDKTLPGYSEPSGGWSWSSGEAWSYTHWNPGEPNNAGAEDFLVGPRWNDVRSGDAASWHVEFGPPPAPAAFLADDAYRMLVGQSVTKTAAAGLLANDLHTPADPAVELVAGPTHGQLTLNADGSFSYTPVAGYQGRDAFRYRTTGPGAAANEATVWLSVGVNETHPVAVNDGYVVDEDSTFVLGPTDDISVGLVHHWKFDETSGDIAEDVRGGKNATLVQWSPGEAKWVAGRLGGAISLGDGDDYLLTEDLPSQAEYTFSLWARRDRDGGLNPRLLASLDREWEILSYQQIGRGVGSDLVQADSPPPIGVWEHYAVTLVAATGETQVFRDGELVASGTSRAAHPQGPWVIGHSPYLDFTDDTWRGALDDLRIYDRVLHTTEIVSLAHHGTSILSNDSDLDGDALSVELVQNVAHGVLSLNADGTFSYTPTPDYIGTDSFTYRVTDGSAWSNLATVTLTVRNQPDPTTTVDDAYSLDEDVPLFVAAAQGVLANDQDLDGMPVGATLVDNVTHGALDLHADGSFVYTPGKDYNGVDQFSYKVIDAAGESNVATVVLTVLPKNDAPAAENDGYATSQVGVVQATALRGVLANDGDPEGDALTAALVQGPAHGALAFNADGSFLYTPAAGYFGQDKFTYRASDGHLQSNLATVTLTVRQATVDVALRAVANPSAADTAAALPASLATVDVGGEYYVEIWVQDVGAAPAGLPGGQIDLDFDTARSDALALGHGGLYNLIPTGAIDEAGGHIDDFGGGTITPAAAGAPQWARLGYVRMSASAHGLASYQLGPGALQFSRVGGGSVPWEQVDLSESVLVDHQAAAELELRVVSQPTAIDAAGEVEALPANQPWVDEWSSYWVEVWVRSTDEGAGQGVAQAAADLLYDIRYGTAREIQYGPAFTAAQTGAIDDATGQVTNLGAATTRNDAGDDRYTLLARVRFAPGAGDQAPLDEAGHFIGPYDLGLGLADPAVRLVGAAADGATELGGAEVPLYAALYDIDDNDRIDYGDLSYFAAAFGKTDAGAIEPPYVWWANFDRQGAVVDFGDFSHLAANFGRSKEQGGLEYPASYPAAWAPLAAVALSSQPLDLPALPLGGDAVGMNVRLVARATPGASDNAAALPAGLTQVAVGGNYTIEVWVQDAAGIGLTGGLVDIDYPQGRVDAGTLEHGGVFTTFAQGTLRELLGRADDLGGGSVAPALGAMPQWVRLGYFSFEVTGAGPLEFKLSPGQMQFSRYGEGNLDWDYINLGSLTLNPALLGDVNSDGAVNLTDFGIFKTNFGAGETWAEGDIDGNGRVDLTDFGLLKANFGRGGAALMTAAVPTPPRAALAVPQEDRHAAAVDLALAMNGEAEEGEDRWAAELGW